MVRGAAAAVIVLGLVVATLPTPTVHTQGQDLAWPEWWDTSWAFRAPLRLPDHVQLPDGSEGDVPEWEKVPVVVELDITDLLIDGGWPEDPDRPGQPFGFTLDEGSFRVVPYDSLGPGAKPVGDPLSIIAVEGALISDSAQPGHEVWTLIWRDAPPFPKQAMVYFDRTEAGVKPAQDIDPVERAAVEQSLYRVGYGHDVVGLVPVTPHQDPGTLFVLGSGELSSHVRVAYASAADSTERPLSGCDGRFISANVQAECELPSGVASDFLRIHAQSETPVAVLVTYGDSISGYQVPALTGGTVGTRFNYIVPPDGTKEGTVVVVIVDDDPCSGPCSIQSNSGSTSASALTPVLITVRGSTPIQTGGPAVVFGMGKGVITGAGAHGGSVGTELYLPGCVDPDGVADYCPTNILATPAGPATASRVILDTGRSFSISTPNVGCGDQPCTRFSGQGKAERFTTDTPMSVVRYVDSDIQDAIGYVVPVLHDGPQSATLPILYEPKNTCQAKLAVAPWDATSDVTVQLAGGGSESIRLQRGQQQSWDIGPSSSAGIALPPPPSGSDPTAGILKITGTAPITGAAYSDCGETDSSREYATFLPAHVSPVVGVHSDLEFVGPFIRTDVTPPLALAQPGDVVSATITLEGGERNIEGHVDALEVQATSPVAVADDEAFPEPPIMNLDSTSFTLTGQKVTAQVTVAVPERVNEDALPATIDVRVPMSAGQVGSRINVNATFSVTVDVTRDFTLTFEDGSTDDSRAIDPGTPDEVPLVLTNTGGADEDIRMFLRAPALPNWDIRLADGDQSVRTGSTVNVPKGEAKRIGLSITPPDSTSSVVFQVVVEGVSTADINLKRAVRLTVLFNTNATFLFQDLNDVCPTYDPFRPCPVTVAPGGVETRNLTLINEGTPISLDLAIEVSGRGFSGGFATEDGIVTNTTIVLGPKGSLNDRAEIPVVINASRELAVGARATALVTAQSTPQPGLPSVTAPPLTLPLLAAAIHSSDVGAGPFLVLPGGNQTITTTVTNNGNLDEQFDVRVLDVPAGWTVEPVDETLAVVRDGTAELRLDVDVPAGAAPGVASLSLLLDPQDGAEGIEASLALNVFEGAVYRLKADVDRTLTVGASRTYTFAVTNAGNDAEPVPVVLNTPPGLDATARPETLAMAPGDDGLLNVTVTARNAGSHSLDIVLGEHSTRLDLVAGTVDLAINGVTLTSQNPVSTIVRVTNNGDIAARNVLVELVSGDEVHDSETIANLAAGDEVAIGLSYSAAEAPSDLAVQTRLASGHADPTPPDNRQLVNQGGSGIPFASVALLIAILATAAVASRRRWRP